MKHLILGALFAVACSKGGSSGGASDVPAKPADGAPMVFEVTSLKPGEMFDSEVAVRAYNFSDKRIAQYDVMLRYHDAKGAVIVKKSTLDTSFDTAVYGFSFQSRKYICEPKTWCTFTIEPEVPPTAVKAEIVAQSLGAVQADGMTMEDAPVYERAGLGREWPQPGPAAAAKPVESR